LFFGFLVGITQSAIKMDQNVKKRKLTLPFVLYKQKYNQKTMFLIQKMHLNY
jgi:hypothetical protein